MGIIMFLIIGALAGWLAGKFIKGSRFGLLANMIVGIIGAILGSFVFRLLGLTSSGLIGSLVTATVGAVLLLYLLKQVKKV